MLNKAPRHEDELGKWKYSSTHYLTSEPDRGEWSASRPGRFSLRKITPGTHRIGGWMGLRADLDMVLKRKFSSLRREPNPDHSVVQPIASCYTD
jgi:hypothetical protein